MYDLYRLIDLQPIGHSSPNTRYAMVAASIPTQHKQLIA
jgi:hypothetical protein